MALINNNKINMGVGRYSYTLYNYLKNKCEIDHYLFDRESQSLKKEGEVIYKSNKNFINPLFKKMRFDNLFLDFWLGRFIPEGYDVYHLTSQDNSLLVYYPNIGKNVITVHDIFYYTFYFNSFKKQLVKQLYYGLKRADAIITVSNETKREIIQHLDIPSDKINVIYPGVDDKFKPAYTNSLYDRYGLDRNKKYILNIGRDEKRKNIKTLLLAFHEFKKDYKMDDVQLLKINSLSRKNLAMIKEMNIGGEITVLEHVTEEDLPKFYSMAELFVFTSIAEGFGFPPLEAMRCGTPVVASKSSAMPEILKDSAILVDPLDYKGFARAFYKILTSDETRDELIKKGIKHSAKFSWEKCANETIKVYKNLGDE